MSVDLLTVTRPGLSASIQDRGRPGLARFGVPPGGAMDDHAAAAANYLLGNPADAPVIELLLHGAELTVKSDVTMAITGGGADCSHPLWQRLDISAGDRIVFSASRSGLWTYVAVAGGLDVPRYFGSASVYPRGRIGRVLISGDVLRGFALPVPAHGESVPATTARDRRNYAHAPILRVWPGPQWDSFTASDRTTFFEQRWTVSSKSDRVGYRLEGAQPLFSSTPIPSEPVLVGSIQVPPHGQPIVTMRDGPTVGGYPKIGLIDPADLSWLAQSRPGGQVCFELIDA